MRVRGHRTRDGAEPALETRGVRLDARDVQRLSTMFGSPAWLRDLGRASWLLVGFLLLLVGFVWLLGETAQIVVPVVAATIVAVVAAPVVDALDRHMPRAAAAAIVLLALVGAAVLILVLVIGGIVGQSDSISTHAAAAATKVAGWLESLGVGASGASKARESVVSAVPAIVSTLTHGVLSGVRGLASLVFGLSLAALSLFFLLEDGPSMRRWVETHLGMPAPVARTIVTGVIGSLRGYFRGVRTVAAFNGVVVLLGALVLGVPLAGTIGLVTFVTAYVPFVGAFVAGAFAVVLALGAKGTVTAVLMLVVVLLANGLLQNIVQPFAMGSALGLNPLVVLVVTIGAGCLFGTLGLILAAPLTASAVHIAGELAEIRAGARHEDVADGAVRPAG